MKRFYKLVTSAKEKGGYAIFLDGKPIKTKAGYALIAPNETLAQMIVLEWAGQGDIILPETMPLTQILNTKIDRVTADRAAVTGLVLKYLDTDLICYPADKPDELVSMQDAIWTPKRLWFEAVSGCTLEVTSGLRALEQTSDAHNYLRGRVSSLSLDVFTILQLVTSLSGSVVLALAFIDGEVSPEEILEACTLEERFKNTQYDAEKYGRDPMEEKKQHAMRRDLDAAHMYLQSLS